MKKNSLWVMAAILSCGLAATSCSTKDNPVRPMEKAEVLALDFEDGEVADYFGLVKAEAALVTPEVEGSTGRAAAIVSGSDRGDYVKTDIDFTGTLSYTVDMDLLLKKSGKATQFGIMTENAWEDWTSWMSNWGIFWKTNQAQEHTAYLFTFEFNNSNTANLMIDYDGTSQNTLDFADDNWYHLTLTVDVNSRNVAYAITFKDDPSILASGEYVVPEGDSMFMKCIYWRNGRLNSGTGAVGVDNVKVNVVRYKN